MKNHQTTGYS